MSLNLRPSGSPGCLVLLVVGLALTSCITPVDDPADSPPVGWRALFDGKTLTGWEVSSFGGEGAVGVSENRIILGAGETLTGVRWTQEFPRTDYELTLEARRLQGSDFFCGMTFPVGDSFCSLIVGERNDAPAEAGMPSHPMRRKQRPRRVPDRIPAGL